jgi:hypothetical protein
MNKAEPAVTDALAIQETPSSGNVVDALERLADAELSAVIKKAQTLLAAREQERRQSAEKKKQEAQREALREIQRLAKQHGLKIDVAAAAKRKPGRPRKAAQA